MHCLNFRRKMYFFLFLCGRNSAKVCLNVVKKINLKNAFYVVEMNAIKYQCKLKCMVLEAGVVGSLMCSCAICIKQTIEVLSMNMLLLYIMRSVIVCVPGQAGMCS